MNTPYTQSFASVPSVTVTHYLGRIVFVKLLDSQGEVIEGVELSDLNQVSVIFSEPLSGTITIF